MGLFRAVNLTTTYALSNTTDQILPVIVAAAQGFRQQWRNVGTLQNKTWEASLGFPVLRRGKLDWTGRLNYERTISTITKLDVPTFYTGGTLQATENMFRVAQGERMGTFYGRRFLTNCAELPGAFRGQCGGEGSAFQRNSDGLIVWVGQGNTLGDGVAKNLWNATLPAAQAPFNVAAAWGHPIVLRDSLGSGAATQSALGQALPKFRWAGSSNLSWGKFTAFGLVDAAVGQSVYNNGRHWSYLDFLSKDQDQTGRSVADVRPTSYYYRAGPPDNGAGIGGLYDVLGPNNFFTEKSTYAKLREVTVNYRFGRLGVLGGDWQLGVTGRNLYTWTDYKGFDPEVGLVGLQAGTFGSGALSAVDAFTFPNLRSVSFNISTRF
jgi:hypothetical protein